MKRMRKLLKGLFEEATEESGAACWVRESMVAFLRMDGIDVC